MSIIPAVIRYKFDGTDAEALTITSPLASALPQPRDLDQVIVRLDAAILMHCNYHFLLSSLPKDWNLKADPRWKAPFEEFDLRLAVAGIQEGRTRTIAEIDALFHSVARVRLQKRFLCLHAVPRNG